MPNFLIVTADDFGLHPAVNEAVEQAHRGGILTAASLWSAHPPLPMRYVVRASYRPCEWDCIWCWPTAWQPWSRA